MKKILLRILAGLGILIAGLVVYVLMAWDKTVDAPLPNFNASKDSTVIARGKYLAYGPAHCATCHVPMDKIVAVEGGLEIPLSGGWELNIPPGSFRAPNLTPDMETGIGKFSDGQLARALRNSIAHNGKILFPFMPFQNLSDDDVTAIISFLRSQPAVKHEVKPTELSFLGKALSAFGAIKPEGPISTPPKSVIMDTSAAYGKYLAHSVANCVGCHTDRDLKTGKFIGEPFAGGMKFEPDAFSKGHSYMTPNITTDKETGVIANWDKTFFVNRFRSGRIHEGSPMPWGAFSRMKESDLKAIYAYLQTVKTVNRKIEKTVYAPGEKFPE